jgi:hypothetical protein
VREDTFEFVSVCVEFLHKLIKEFVLRHLAAVAKCDVGHPFFKQLLRRYSEAFCDFSTKKAPCQSITAPKRSVAMVEIIA